MIYEGGYAGLTSGQYRTFLVGFSVPVMFGLFGITFPSFAMATGDLDGFGPFVLIPGFILAGWMQVETTIAGGRNADRVAGAKRRMRALLLVPMGLVVLALLVSTIGVIRLSAGDPNYAWVGLIFALIAAAFLVFTARARRIPWLQA